jgi:hypothetical protein
MPSITYWNRLEPRARSNDLAGALAARVRDPAWFLARQWQLGEFAGDDSGSPAYVRIAAALSPMLGWQGAHGAPTPMTAGAPLESAALSEPFSPDDVTLRVELGNLLEILLAFYGVSDLRTHWLDAFPIGAAPAGFPDDVRSARLRTLWQGRVIDGHAVYQASLVAPQPPPEPPPGVPGTVPQPRWAAASQAVQQFRTAAESIHPGAAFVAAADSSSWRADRLDHELKVFTGQPGDSGSVGAATLDAHPDRHGDLTWYAFDATTDAVPPGLPAPSRVDITRSVIPGPVKFRGMPNERFWDFEDGRVDIGALRLDRRDLVGMVLVDFMLVHGDDWFLVPFEQPAGTLCRSELTVVDVFGGHAVVPRAEDVDSEVSSDKRWSLFSISGLGHGHLVVDSAAGVVQDGRPFEDVRFLRDETANLAWAVERTTESPLGRSRPGHERVGEPPPPASTGIASLRYQLQTHVPGHWIPFHVAAVPPAGSAQVALEMASLLAPDGEPAAPLVAAQPWSRILRPSSLPPGSPYRIREEEVPREGTQVTRSARWARSTSGAGHLWVARKRTVGGGEGWSGLGFDRTFHVDEVVEPPTPEPITPLRWDTPPGWSGGDWT